MNVLYLFTGRTTKYLLFYTHQNNLPFFSVTPTNQPTNTPPLYPPYLHFLSKKVSHQISIIHNHSNLPSTVVG